MERLESADKAILGKMADSDWMNLYWIDEIKEEFSDVPEKNIDEIYSLKLKEKVDGLSIKVLLYILAEQRNMTSDDQNPLLQNLIKEKLALSQGKQPRS
ncbi:MAG: hypothetical protein ABSA46_02845 [Thermodesulfovibrionales bacterium]|jgi:hypothetical protein